MRIDGSVALVTSPEYGRSMTLMTSGRRPTCTGAAKVVKAIREDSDELNPGGAERLAKLLPKALLDLATRPAFDR